jgi:hypothetical protein
VKEITVYSPASVLKFITIQHHKAFTGVMFHATIFSVVTPYSVQDTNVSEVHVASTLKMDAA